MASTLWLHCGSFKTGSSRIQNEAWDRREQLLAKGWHYPETGVILTEPEVGFRHSQLVYAYKHPEEWGRLVARLGAEINAVGAANVILSSEAWSHPSSRAALADLVTALRGECDIAETRLVLYLRNRYDYARSLYRELTRRRGNVLPFSEFIDLAPRALDYVALVKGILGAASPAVATIYRYEGVGDVAEHFFRQLGVDIASAPQHTNKGMGALEIEACRQINLMAPRALAHWPGLAAVACENATLSDGAYGERFADGQLVEELAWKRELAELCTWPDSEVEALCRKPEDSDLSIASISSLVGGLVQCWVESICTQRLKVTVYPDSGVDLLQLEAPTPGLMRFRITGLLLLSSAEPTPVELVAVGVDEVMADLGRASPGLARQYPHRPEAATARFAIPRVGFGSGNRVDLVLRQPSGARRVVASLHRHWEPHEGLPRSLTTASGL